MSLMTYTYVMGISFVAGCVLGLFVSPRDDDYIDSVLMLGYCFTGVSVFLLLALDLIFICFGGN